MGNPETTCAVCGRPVEFINDGRGPCRHVEDHDDSHFDHWARPVVFPGA